MDLKKLKEECSRMISIIEAIERSKPEVVIEIYPEYAACKKRIIQSMEAEE